MKSKLERTFRIIGFGIIFALIVCETLKPGTIESLTGVEIPKETDVSASNSEDFPNNYYTNLIFDGEPSIIINNDKPFFTNAEIARANSSFEDYSELDYLGRTTGAVVSCGLDTLPEEERGNISNVRPSGWINAEYEIVDGGYLYNRCHLIGFQLTGENDNARNLITGTRYLNIDGMLEYENLIAEYIDTTNNHVLYRVTPIYSGTELVCRGLLMEAYSVEDNGDGISFCRYCFNVQPGIIIDYMTGESCLEDTNG